jgi:hypothetical protein
VIARYLHAGKLSGIHQPIHTAQGASKHIGNLPFSEKFLFNVGNRMALHIFQSSAFGSLSFANMLW